MANKKNSTAAPPKASSSTPKKKPVKRAKSASKKSSSKRASKKSPSKKSGKKRAYGSASTFIRSCPVEMSAKEVVAKAKSKGLKIKPALVYNVRAKMKSGVGSLALDDSPPPPPSPKTPLIIGGAERETAMQLLLEGHKRIIRECGEEFFASYMEKLARLVKVLPHMPPSIGEIIITILDAISAADG